MVGKSVYEGALEQPNHSLCPSAANFWSKQLARHQIPNRQSETANELSHSVVWFLLIIPKNTFISSNENSGAEEVSKSYLFFSARTSAQNTGTAGKE